MAKKYTKSHSNYILKSNPSATKVGYIYENDLPTTSPGYNTVNGNMTITTDGGFTFIVNSSPDDSKSYNTDGWGVKSYTLSDINVSDSDFISVDNSQTKSAVKSQKYVKLNKSYSDFSDYCYFGSSNAMLKASVNGIINNFPAALYINDLSQAIINNHSITIPISGITNPFNIDLVNYSNDNIKINYDLRVISSSYTDFVIMRNDIDISKITEYYSTSTAITLVISELIDLGSPIYIVPNSTKRDEFFNSLDNFQSVLLDRYTVPKYKSSFKIPTEGATGIEFVYENFVWETSDGYNLDIQSSNYSLFMTDLINSTNFIDELYSDNLYRMLTHDTIKNLDSTYTREINEDDLEDILIGGTKVQSLLRLYGRSFDELKNYIEGISYANTISYDGKNNLPSDYLTGRIETSGWDSFALSAQIGVDTITSPSLFPSTNKTYSVQEVDNHVMKNIILNSKNIFRSKGTNKSIRKILGVLGIDNNWYETREYIQAVDNFITGDTLKNIASLNYQIYPENMSIADGKPEFEYSFDQSLFNNTNIGIFVKCPTSGSENYIVSGDTYGDGNTGICIEDSNVFDITANTIGYPMPMPNSSTYYFQQKGNWYRETGGVHADISGNTYVNEISYGNNPHIGNGEYDNGFDYIDQFSSLFKRYIRNGRNSILPGYDNVGFSITGTKSVDNKKINYNDTSALLNISNNDNRLILNTKIFVIGFDGDKILQSFFNNNNLIENVINTNSYNINDSNKDLIQIINKSGTTNIGLDIASGSKKIHNSLSGNGNPVIVNGKSIPAGKTVIAKTTNDGITIENYLGYDEFNIIKSIVLPYLEQIIPSTTIFDFVLKNDTTPKWLLIDEYCERDVNGDYTGYKIISYQNVNYFTNGTIKPNKELTDIIKSNFGEGFILSNEISSIIDNSITMISEDGNNLIMENGDIEINENSTGGLNSIFHFKRLSEDCGLNTEPDWVIDNNIS